MNAGEWFRLFLLAMRLFLTKTASAAVCKSKAITYTPVQFYEAGSVPLYLCVSAVGVMFWF